MLLEPQEGVGIRDREFRAVERVAVQLCQHRVAAEQLVGFYNAFQLTRDAQFKTRAERSWDYIMNKFVDKDKGEWFGTVKADGTPVKGDKINFWKCPYHNARACAEMWRRVSKA